MSTKSKQPLVDLTEFLDPDFKPKPLVKRIEIPEEVVYFWTQYKCKCGMEYSSPTFGEKPLARFRVQKLRHNKYVDDGYILYPVPCAGAHKELPRVIDTTNICLDICPACINTQHEYFFKQPKELPEMTLSQMAVDTLLFSQALEAGEANLESLNAAISDKGEVSVFHDKETN